MLNGPKGTGQDKGRHCSVCGVEAKLVQLPGRTEKYCLACSADLASTILLITEIDAATLAGRSTSAMLCELDDISCRMLHRSQSAA
jgi:hypothetical protein